MRRRLSSMTSVPACLSWYLCVSSVIIIQEVVDADGWTAIAFNGAAATPVGFVNDDTWKAVASAFICIVVCASGAGVGSVTETRGTGTESMVVGEWTVLA
jgi:hypothetical protein